MGDDSVNQVKRIGTITVVAALLAFLSWMLLKPDPETPAHELLDRVEPEGFELIEDTYGGETRLYRGPADRVSPDLIEVPRDYKRADSLKFFNSAPLMGWKMVMNWNGPSPDGRGGCFLTLEVNLDDRSVVELSADCGVQVPTS